MASNNEQGFNDAELQDIMSEIENLEKEYEDDKPEGPNVEMTQDKKIEAEVMVENAGREPVETEEINESEDIVDNIVKFESKKETKESTQKVEFYGSGQVDFSLSFNVAGQTASLKITDEGLVVDLEGMHLSIDEAGGCTVEMDGGVKFSVPVNGHGRVKKVA